MGDARIGVEEEFHVVDLATRRAAPEVEALLDRLPGDGFSPELQRSLVETNTSPCDTLDALRVDLVRLRGELAGAAGRALLVFSHNPLDGTAGGEEALAALDATPGVVALIAGNSHRNRIRPRATARGGYWQIGTSSLADHPQQARMLRLRRSGDGYALETWMLDHDGGGLAGAARELAFLDAQGGRPQGFAGTGPDRNARLFVAG
ncbi:MAG: glutamate-cysteine ligase family protein [Solirubrobacteraceae bacterium]